MRFLDSAVASIVASVIVATTLSSGALAFAPNNHVLPSLTRSNDVDSFGVSQTSLSSTVEKEITRFDDSKTTSLEETTNDENTGSTFANEGLFAWMQPYLTLFGFEEGKTTFYGPPVSVDRSRSPSPKESAALRAKAAAEFTNINEGERERRRRGGEAATVVSAFYAVYSSLLLDDGDFGGHLARFAIVLPLLFAVGYGKSAESGLCNIAQGGYWDVDGSGIKKIDDPNLARAFLERVNKMNLDTGRDVLVASLVFAALPQDVTAPLAGWGLILGGLYFLNGRLPEDP